MPFNIIVKGKNQPSSSKRFVPHMNWAMGKYVHTKQDYLDTMKKMDLVPYEKPKEQGDPVYKSSKWSHDMVNEIQRSGGKPGSKFYQELEKKGVSREKIKQMNDNRRTLDYIDNSKGGYF